MKTKYLSIAGFIMIFSFLLISCSDSTNGIEPRNTDLGEVEFSVSGDIDGQRSGSAFFSMEDQGGHTFQLTFMDGFEGRQTFAFYITRYRLNAFEMPDTGSYEIDGNLFNFSADYDDYSTGDWTDAGTYTDAYCDDVLDQGGTLTINSRTEQQITGSFSFTVASFDDFETCNLLGYLQVQGEFRAVPFENSLLF